MVAFGKGIEGEDSSGSSQFRSIIYDFFNLRSNKNLVIFKLALGVSPIIASLFF